jgi:hypothetical protein
MGRDAMSLLDRLMGIFSGHPEFEMVGIDEMN